MNVVLLLSGIILILLVLIQRGKGGGVSGMIGGAGGSSAFGSRAGDIFTRVTIYVALVWILMIMVMIKMVQPGIPVVRSDPAMEGKEAPGTPPPSEG